MKHYNIEEWNEFKSNNLDNILMDEMQDHLLECNDCLNLYLSTIGDNEIENASKSMPGNFTDEVMNRIHLEDYRINTTKKKSYFTNILIYYVSAACITLLLMSQGVFHSLVNNVPYASSILTENTSKSERLLTSGWTDHLTQITSAVLNDLFNKNGRDSFEK